MEKQAPSEPSTVRRWSRNETGTVARTGADVWLSRLGVGSLNLVDMEAVFMLKQSLQTVLMSCQSAKDSLVYLVL